MLSVIPVGEGFAARSIACLDRPGTEPALVWFGGFRSDMRATKADALDAWAATAGMRFVRFDYSGHGESGGLFEDGTISRWLDEGLAVLEARGVGRALFVGSSMGAWIATLAALRLRRDAPGRAPAGLVLIAPAIDFTERLMWDSFDAATRATLLETGTYSRPSLYDVRPYPITRALIEDGRRHLILDGPIDPGCPVHVLQGQQDPDVPWEHAVRFVEHLPAVDVQVTLIRDGDHRLSRPEDLDRLIRAIEGMLERSSAGTGGG